MTKLYALFVGPGPDDVRKQKQIEQQMLRSEHLRRTWLIPKHLFSILPWSLEELPGTSWRNAHTARLETVHRLGENRWGKVGPDPSEYGGGMFSIGIWRDSQFCIEHWVRVDHLPPKLQIEWAVEHIARCRAELLRSNQEFDKAKREGRGLTCRIHEIGWRTADLERARQEFIALRQQLGITPPIDILNTGIQSGEQMRMF